MHSHSPKEGANQLGILVDIFDLGSVLVFRGQLTLTEIKAQFMGLTMQREPVRPLLT